jgi:flagellar motor protein MotB
LRGKKAQSAEGGPKVPGYIVTFSDMTTLLLTFFVMLLSLATTQDPELFNVGRDSFVESLKGLGLGMLIGKDQAIEFGNPKTKYPIKDPEKTFSKRTLDAKEERIRRLFNKLSSTAKTMPGRISGSRYDFPITGVHFAAGGAELDGNSKQALNEFCKKLSCDSKPETLQLFVLGLTDRDSADRPAWVLSAMRARVVADFVTNAFVEDNRPAVYSCGAGPGRFGSGKNAVPKDCQIVIAVLR